MKYAVVEGKCVETWQHTNELFHKVSFVQSGSLFFVDVFLLFVCLLNTSRNEVGGGIILDLESGCLSVTPLSESYLLNHRLGMMVHHDPECRVKGLARIFKVMVGAQIPPQKFLPCSIYPELLNLLHPNLVYWCITTSRSVVSPFLFTLCFINK